MGTSLIGAVAIYFLKESAQRPLPGSMPSVDTQAEARELVATQDENPLIDLDQLPFETQDITDSSAADKVPARV
jgi:MHS family proline/betaine transporter-like MFS transporter